MTEQRHRICRQVFELHLDDDSAAWPVQSALSRLQAQQLVPLINACLSECCPPDQLLRIERLELDLGALSLPTLEHDLVQRIQPALRQALHQRQQQAATDAALLGDAPQTDSQLELIAQFLQTGSVPWWADANQPRLLATALRHLLSRPAADRTAQLRSLLAQRSHRLRLIQHSEDAELVPLLQTLLASPPLSRAALAADVCKRLPAGLRRLAQGLASGLGLTAAPLRSALWLGFLRAACPGARPVASDAEFYAEALAGTALEADLGHAALVTALVPVLIDAAPEPAPALRQVLASVSAHPQAAPRVADATGNQRPATTTRDAAESSAEIPGAVAAHATAHDSAHDSASVAGRLSAELSGDGTAQPPRAAAETSDSPPEFPWESRLESRADSTSTQWQEPAPDARPPARPPTGTVASQRAPLAPGSDRTASDGESDTSSPAAVGAPSPQPAVDSELPRPPDLSPRIPPDWGPDLASDLASDSALDSPSSHTPDSGSAADSARDRDAAENSESAAQPAASLSSEPTAAEAPIAVLCRALQARRPDLAAAARESVDHVLQAAALLWPGWTLPMPAVSSAHATVQPAPLPPTSPTVARRRLLRALVHLRTLGIVPSSTLQPALAAVRAAVDSAPSPAAATQDALPSSALARTPPADSHPAADPLPKAPRSPQAALRPAAESYVEYAGLVVLWPFLTPLLQNLGLLDGSQFVDRAAAHRAVGLLHYLATAETRPQEYQVVLPKLLCGLAANEVLDLGEPLTEAEVAECRLVLRAALAHTPWLSDLSEDDFRATYILRRGVLSPREDAWLLRVERREDGAPSQPLPWPLTWIRLPWLDGPLYVEW